MFQQIGRLPSRQIGPFLKKTHGANRDAIKCFSLLDRGNTDESFGVHEFKVMMEFDVENE